MWSICLLGGVLLVNACGISKSTQKTQSTRTLRLTALDSTSGTPLDSARAVNRTLGDTLRTDSAGMFVMRDIEPALYVFDVSGYGYHSQRHVSVLVEPEDTNATATTTLLPQLLSINCEGSRPYNWDYLTEEYKKDSTQVRIQLIEVFADDGEVQVQPVVVNDMPTTTLFLPNNFGALGHYDVQLYDGNSNRIPFHYKNAPPDQSGHRIYSKGDILPVVPKGTERLDPTTLVVGDSIEDGRTIYARLRYTFSTEDTLQATSATTFPELNLDSLQVPVFDTLRTDGRVRVPDSLVIQRDTTRMRVVGIDTTVTRSGYTLFSTLRDSNAASTAQAARNMLYVPDSVKTRARRDSLEARAAADTTVPDIDTTAVGPATARYGLHIVDRTDRLRLDSLLTNDDLAQSLAGGLPDRDMTADSLLALSETLRDAFLRIPVPSTTEVQRGLETEPDSVRRDSVILSAPVADSLFRIMSPDTLSEYDSTGSIAQRNPFLPPDRSARMTPGVDSIPIDSLQLTVAPDADSVVTDTVIAENLSNPPAHTYWFVPDSLSLPGTQVLAVDPTFFRLRARAHVDTTTTIDVEGLLPARVGKRPQIASIEYPQQVIRSPAGTYRSAYLQVWKKLQSNQLKQQYCQIFPFPLRSEWRSTSMH
ncbi:hypothetical protein BSZ35_14575 [Salinibacter sp. 10B]|nr:hypothetical protein BSZ35_14575 [Salinibacter sp. 10B]